MLSKVASQHSAASHWHSRQRLWRMGTPRGHFSLSSGANLVPWKPPVPADTIVQTQSLCFFFFSSVLLVAHSTWALLKPSSSRKPPQWAFIPKAPPPELIPSTFCACYLREENCLSIMFVSPPSSAPMVKVSHKSSHILCPK